MRFNAARTAAIYNWLFLDVLMQISQVNW